MSDAVNDRRCHAGPGHPLGPGAPSGDRRPAAGHADPARCVARYRARRGSRAGRRIRRRQDHDRQGHPGHPAVRRADYRRVGPLRRPGHHPPAGAGPPPPDGPGPRPDSAGPADLAQPGLSDRRPDRRCAAPASRHGPGCRRGKGAGAARRRPYPRAGTGHAPVSARAFRRHAPARVDRHRLRLPAQADRRGRADDRARRDGAAPGARP